MSGLIDPAFAEDAVSERVPEIRHAGGWAPDKALCGAQLTGNLPRFRTPMHPECIVCWDIWLGMDEGQRDALWSLYR